LHGLKLQEYVLGERNSSIGFPPVPEIEELVDALVNDPPEVRWRALRVLLRVGRNGAGLLGIT
jgi:hypothetical protein